LPDQRQLLLKHWQAIGHRQQGKLPIGCGIKPYFPTGSYAILERTMKVCAKFDQDHTPPGDEAALVVYCKALGLVLAQLHRVGAGYVGAEHNIMSCIASCVPRFCVATLFASCAHQFACR
jgi:hypothetical protein